MRTIWHSLAWKEWHEHKWKLVSLLAILWAVTSLFLLDVDRGMLIGIGAALAFGIVPLAIFVGLGTAAGERSRGTLPFLQALPVPMWRVALHKMAFGLVTILVPALLSVALVIAWCKCLDLRGIEYDGAADAGMPWEIREIPFAFGTENLFADSALAVAFSAVSFYVWTIAAGVNRKDEVSAGAVALTVVTVWWVLLSLLWRVSVRSWGPFAQWREVPEKWLAVIGVSTAPGSLPWNSEMSAGINHALVAGTCVSSVTLLALATWYVCRFGRISDREIRSPKTAVRGTGPDWLDAPRRSPLAAIAWKQVRESGPLVLVGLAIIAGTVVVLWIGTDRSFLHLVDIYPVASAAVGFAVAMIVGIGAFYYDVGPRLNEFWRSRPISPDVWFWTKFSSGVAIILAAIYGPIVLGVLPGIIALIASPDFDLAVLVSRLAASIGPALLLFPVITVALFAAAAAMMCLVRNAVYAAILSIAVVYLGFVATAIAIVVVQLARGERGLEYFSDVFDDVTPLQGAAGLSLTFVICTLVAWLAVRYDWGRKSRY
jgi:hypothetical protein